MILSKFGWVLFVMTFFSLKIFDIKYILGLYYAYSLVLRWGLLSRPVTGRHMRWRRVLQYRHLMWRPVTGLFAFYVRIKLWFYNIDPNPTQQYFLFPFLCTLNFLVAFLPIFSAAAHISTVQGKFFVVLNYNGSTNMHAFWFQQDPLNNHQSVLLTQGPNSELIYFRLLIFCLLVNSMPDECTYWKGWE